MTLSKTVFFRQLALVILPLLVEAGGTQTLPTLYIDGQQTANSLPATTYESPVSNLEFEPRVDLQSRNMAEAQGDVTIRGGIFENTGFRVGSATLLDPQTGHYFAELPIAPEMLSRPAVQTGSENALYGFNSTVGTISYGWSRIADGGSLTVGGGDHDLNFQRIHHGLSGPLDQSGDWTWGLEGELSRSESDGTIRFGDHDFNRTSGRVQVIGPNSQTDFFAGYQAKFFGWPGLYTAERFANPENLTLSPEYENLKTRLFIANHRQYYGDDSFIELTATHRRHTDHYFLDATDFTPFPFEFVADHETKATSLAFSGYHRFDQAVGINYAGQTTTDEIESSSLEQGDFTSRRYIKLSLLPEYRFKLSEEESITLRMGTSFDDSNRDSSELSLISDITWTRRAQDGDSESLYLSYSEASQVAGYTAIGGSESSGIFRSKHDLERETSQNLEFGGALERSDWSLEAAIFYRWDDDLADWTYLEGDTFARSASNVDIETFGIELIGSKRWGELEGIASYTYLHKDEHYGNDTVAASFYALNYANHRVTLGTIWRPCDLLEVRLDNEWRQNEDNRLREGSDSALHSHLGLSVYPPQIESLELFFAIDNLWDDDFQDVPGTPGRGDQYSAGLTYRW